MSTKVANRSAGGVVFPAMRWGNNRRMRSFAFISSNNVWGGSEELWSLTALVLARQGHAVSVLKPHINPDYPRLAALVALGAKVNDIHGSRWIPRKLRSALLIFWPTAWLLMQFCVRVGLRHRPDLIIISQGINFDGHSLANICWRMGLPFVLISQKAANMYWPSDNDRGKVQAMYMRARAALFVSRDNLRQTEEQLGCALPNAVVVRNPFQAAWAQRNDWPDEANGYHFVCLARLDMREKGQDVLLRVLSMPKWRERPISVRFVGAGHNAKGLEQMAKYLNLTNVRYTGHTDQPSAVWDDCHGLILPSHCEGLPLSLVEAMLSARLAIVTDVGGAREVIEDGTTGFLAEAATVRHLDEAMERAWTRRTEWRAIGQAAATHIRTLVPADPPSTLASQLLEMIAQQEEAVHA